MTQEELAFRAALHRTEIGLIERGLRAPRLATLLKLACCLDIPLDSLADGLSWQPVEDGEDGRFDVIPLEEDEEEQQEPDEGDG